MSELRWIEGPVHCTDLVNGTGRVLGYVGPTAKGVRGYVVQSSSEWPPRFASKRDHGSDEAARAWVEAEIAQIHGGRTV
ncbi:hypothetical protein SAMN05216360_10515 [Methylobacterium phyllostachyos]|uniref:Uncharacterized protein n=1 Tax=Methylobacterium phyllostachyos TaxID=582672 RepID=A0A1G9XTH7_9HYPH|nr:hypothetical protein [Methylobacterium phyllostachyos]SDM99716.1 hypothetical protein SAMN05216360_10515 [Methylobacterium phyllostachyos]